jgi:crotonobetainyl-CoA:carnitine CoA-transferase CaiB-like acyl-CoA transferase
MAGADPEPDGNHVDWCAPHNAYPAKGTDEWLVIAAETEAQWEALAEAAGLDDPRFETLAGRKAHEAELDAALGRWTSAEDKHALATRLQGLGVAAAPVMTPRDLAASPYLAARGFFTELAHPVAGRHPHIGLPFHAEETQGSARKAAPGFGEDNHWVLANLAGLSETAIEALEEAGALSTRPPLGV